MYINVNNSHLLDERAFASLTRTWEGGEEREREREGRREGGRGGGRKVREGGRGGREIERNEMLRDGGKGSREGEGEGRGGGRRERGGKDVGKGGRKKDEETEGERRNIRKRVGSEGREISDIQPTTTAA